MPFTENQRRWHRVNIAKKQAKLDRDTGVQRLERAERSRWAGQPEWNRDGNWVKSASGAEPSINADPPKRIKFPPTNTVKQRSLRPRTRHSGPLGKAKMLTAEQFEAAEQKAVERGQYGTRDQLFILLSRFAALRSAEIATIHLEDLTDAEGKFTGSLQLSSRGAKYGKQRTICLRDEVRGAIEAYVRAAGIRNGPIFWTQRGDPMTPNAVQKQMKAAFIACGFRGARSHSGRRYAITTMAQNANRVGASLEDVRMFAGHSNISTTSAYIDQSPFAAQLIQFL